MQVDLNPSGNEKALDPHRCFGTVAVGVANDVVGGLVGRQDHGVREGIIETGRLADALDERARQRHKRRSLGIVSVHG